ncbi:MAG: GTPase Era [Clostridiales bacterium]|jgi:GTP-binding protein Era|nr:GTPase Era [Clostridiales bacterium]
MERKAGKKISSKLFIDISNEQGDVPFSEGDRRLMAEAASAAFEARLAEAGAEGAGDAGTDAGAGNGARIAGTGAGAGDGAGADMRTCSSAGDGAGMGAGGGDGAVAAALAAGGMDADVCARLVDDGEMRRLNREFRGVDRATDVLSFPMAGDGLETDPQTGRAILGDIAISPARAAEQADEYGHPYSRELAFLTVHGVLHLMGCDHDAPEGEKAMKALQERALAAVGQARPASNSGEAGGPGGSVPGGEAGAADESALGEADAGAGSAADVAAGNAGESSGCAPAGAQPPASEAASGNVPGAAPGAESGWAGYRAGFACLAGRPNTGKSTLLNRLTGEKLAIVSSKPQTTRKNIKAMLSSDGCQIIFIDTPGAHSPKNKLGEHMMRSVRAAVRDVDLILLLVDARSKDFDGQDLELLKLAEGARIPVVLLINKTDLVQKDSLLPLIGRLSARSAFEAVIPISARTGDGLERILPEIRRLLPEGPPLYPTDSVTDQTERQLAADTVREKALQLLDEEVPHGIETEVERFAPNDRGTALEIYAVLYCEKESHKKIIIGKNGESLKKIGAAARLDLERAFGRKVFLSLWVKLKKDWRNDAAALRRMGYGSDAGGG